MNLIDLSIEARGFTPASVSIALRTIGTCIAACHRPDNRALTGIGLLIVTPVPGGYRFDTQARCLLDDDVPIDLVDWLEERLPEQAAIVSWSNWGSVPKRLAALADPARHPQLTEATADTAGRWRDMPRGHTWHLRQARANAMPCLCEPGVKVDECHAELPMALLPDPDVAARQLIDEAIGGWHAWIRDLAAFDDHDHPAWIALRALDAWRTDQRDAA